MLLLLSLSLALGFNVKIKAQAVYGSVSGTVTDTAGAVVPDAAVTITNVERKTVDTVNTNSDGFYLKDRLLPGVYEVRIEKQGFKSGLSDAVNVSVDTQTKVDVSLETGQVSEVVTVSTEGQLLKTDRADVATTFSNRDVTELPILDRNLTRLVLLTPGTQQQLWQHAAAENPQGSVQTIVNGQTFSGTGYQLDGTDNRDPILGIIVINPNPESVGEFKFTSSNYDAEFGQAIAGVASVQTKSGTNDIRGSAFYFLQRDRFQARNPFTQSQPIVGTNRLLPESKRDQFGGSIGGPIIKNRFFFFGDYQGTRATQGGSRLLTVPTALARTGNLSEYGVDFINPSTGQLYANRTIPACGAGQTPAANGCLSTQALNILALFPAPIRSGVVDNFVGSGSEKSNNDVFNVRLDGRISDNFNLFGRYSRAKFNLNGGTALGAAGGQEFVSLGGNSNVRNQSLALGFDYVLTPTTVLDFRFGYFDYTVGVRPFDFGQNTATDVGVPGLNLDELSSGLFAGFTGVSGPAGNRDINFGSGLGVNRCNCPLDQREKQYQIVTNLSKVIGNHNLKFGIDVRRAFNLRIPSDNHRSGELTFARERTGRNPTTANGTDGVPGLSLATFLTGDVTGFRRYVSSSTNARERQWRHFYYGQDTWKVNQKLTLALGLRADVINPQSINEPGNGGFVDLETGEIRVAGVGDNKLNGNVENSVNFAPRLGVTYQLNNRMVLRAGFGRSFDIGVFGSVFGHTVTQNLPVLAVQNLNAATNRDRVFTLASGPPAFNNFFGITTPANRCPATGCVQNTAIPENGRFFIPDGVLLRALPEKQTLPRVDAYNVTFQWELQKNLSLEVAYVGNNGKNVFVGDNPDLNINQPTIEGFAQGVPTNQRRPLFQRFGLTQDVLLYGGYGATNRYDSLQTKLTRRFTNGYSFQSSYTLQKAVNDGRDYYSVDPSVNRGRADFERTHNFIFFQTLDIPIGRNRRFFSNIGRLTDFLVGGFQFNSTTILQSGLHFNVEYNGGADRDTGPNRPDLIGEIRYPGTRERFVDPSSFARPAIGTFGNLERNAFTGPSYFQTNASLFKRFAFTETKQLEFRVEVVNLFNTVNLNNPDTNLGDALANGSFSNAGIGGGFGRITNTAYNGNDPQRNLQFALRFLF